MDENNNQIEVLSNEVSKEQKVVKSDGDLTPLYKKVKRLEILSIISILLLAGLLVFNITAVNRSGATSEIASQKALPEGVDNNAANKIINEIKDAYNAQDNDRLYNVMGEFAKTLISKEEFYKTMEQVSILGKLESASYTHYTYLENSDGADFFQLNYIAKYQAGNGKALVTIRANEEGWEVVGFRFNVDNIQNLPK